jgi:hypothetical protein
VALLKRIERAFAKQAIVERRPGRNVAPPDSSNVLSSWKFFRISGHVGAPFLVNDLAAFPA